MFLLQFCAHVEPKKNSTELLYVKGEKICLGENIQTKKNGKGKKRMNNALKIPNQQVRGKYISVLPSFSLLPFSRLLAILKTCLKLDFFI